MTCHCEVHCGPYLIMRYVVYTLFYYLSLYFVSWTKRTCTSVILKNPISFLVNRKQITRCYNILYNVHIISEMFRTHHKYVPETAGRHTETVLHKQNINFKLFLVFTVLNSFNSYRLTWLLLFAISTEHVNVSSYKNHRSKLLCLKLVRYFRKLHYLRYPTY